MKRTILSMIACLGVLGSFAQGEFGFGLQYINPRGAMSNTIRGAGGLTLSAAHNFEKPFAAGMQFAYNSYGHSRTKQQYTFDDGSVTDTYVNIANYFLSLNLDGKMFLRNGKNINPYIGGKLGYAWYKTSLTIEDPEDETACEPLESHILSKDGTLIATGGGGVRIDMSSIFGSVEKGRFYFDFNAYLTSGGRVKYMNVDHHPQKTPDRDVMAKFINNQTQVVHEHHVGYQYSALLNQMEYQFAFIIMRQ